MQHPLDQTKKYYIDKPWLGRIRLVSKWQCSSMFLRDVQNGQAPKILGWLTLFAFFLVVGGGEGEGFNGSNFHALHRN